ncbi:hypothetical protein SEA_BETTERKATZ_46 [Gordonia phage BetterKatz]|uniref:Uncharacterized protein n=1 Tax=Gordonia phage BetterKatz TaxID=1821551 RepID=A0A142KC48_9CAUD|nr:hypothetical protein BJD67_gp46 [Gordonia phage BetterKatz]AMS03681.1 hypothetical protein SEA_BETTERKATZ_46 [Gordonia phage BetterKatz]
MTGRPRRRIYRLGSAGDVTKFTRCAQCGKAIAYLAHVQVWVHVVEPVGLGDHMAVVPRFVIDVPERFARIVNQVVRP